MAKDKAVSLPVHTQRICDGRGLVCIEQTVDCPLVGPTSMERCERCERLELIGLDDEGQPMTLVCRPGVKRPSPPARGLLHGEDAAHTPVEAVMSPDVACVTCDVGVADIAALFLDEGVSAVPVVDYDHFPIGVLSKTDLIRPEVLAPAGPGRGARAAASLLGPTLHTIAEGESLATAAARMVDAHIHHLLVVGRDGRLVGMLSSFDLMRWIAARPR
jgi:CBS-domain-containing membrane protein